jgi:Ca-activated chloride channel family protein
MTLDVLSAPEGVFLIAGAIGLMVMLWWALASLERRRARRLEHFADANLLARLVTGHAPGRRWPLNALVLAGALALLLALAQPRWGEGVPGTRRGSREILVLLDTSESMNAVNPAPTRLGRAQSKIGALLEACSGDRFGLIAFSGAAVVECPFTRDHAYFKTVLQSITTESLTEEGTNIAAALGEAELFFEGEKRAGSGAAREDRMILLVSDGESAQEDALERARRLSDSSRIAVLGIGDPGGAEVKLPSWMERSRFAPAVAGGSHWSALNEDALSSIALAGGGLYVRSTLGNEDIEVILREMASLEGIQGGGEAGMQQVNRYRWPLGLALLLFVAEGAWLVWMPHRSRRAAAEPSAREVADEMG